jgi:type I restriction enzyme S subunit
MGWEFVKLGDLVHRKIGYGIVQPGSSVDVGVPVIKVNNIISGLSNIELLEKTTTEIDAKYTRTRLVGGELVISLVGSVGKTAIVPKTFAGCNLVRATGLIDIKDEILAKWVKYYIDSPLGQAYINSNVNTTVQVTLNIKSLVDMPIPLPEPTIREKIVAILSSIDDKIELNRRINTNLEQQAQALYKSWFVDFEPFGGKMPEDWRVGTLGEIITITSGKHPKNRVSIKTKDVNIPIVGAADIIGYTNEMLYSIPILIIGRVGTHGIVQRFSTKSWPSDNTLVIQTKYYEMCYQLLKQIDYKKLNRGSTQPLITQTDIKGVEVIIPPIEILEEYEKRVSILFHSINNYDIENSSLSALRDTLLPKLMSGEITV